MRKYALDTNIYIRAFRDKAAARELEQFFFGFAPSTYLSAIVLHELIAGATTVEKASQIEDAIARPLRKVRRLFGPSNSAWERAGEIISHMAREEGLEVARTPRSLVNDLLLALSCRESGIVLVTTNSRDFERIGRYIDIDFIEPWPGNEPEQTSRTDQ